jgi:hypothetical protein
MLRRLTRHPRTQAAAAAMLGGYLSLVARTTRWTVVGAEHVAAAVGDRTDPAGALPPGIILAFWHERLAIMPLCWQLAHRTMAPLIGSRAHVLVSRHRDGRLIGDVAGRFDLSMVHGSSTRGGAAGLIALTRLLAAGDHVVITPDGPRGPRRRAAPGVAHLAALTGRPVLPCGSAVSRGRVLSTWDRMVLPLPFGRGALVVGPPIQVPRDGAAAALPAIEAALGAVCDAADALVRPGASAAAPRMVAA